jgi:NAD(P)-dependent dehydrogenase (short-subunit alcohol dehydrogenase family)
MGFWLIAFSLSSMTTTNNMTTFQDKVVVITGGGSGIGAALAKAFATAGAIVVVVDLKGSEDVVKSLPNAHKHASSVCDVSDQHQVRNMIREVKRRHHGRIDIYCSNAGIVFPPSSDNDAVARHSDAQWSKILKVNLLSHVIAARELLPDWERGGVGDGHFIITASAAGLLTMIGDATYGVSKAAAVSFAEHMAISHANIHVHCLCPQAVDTPFIPISNSAPNNAALTDGILSADYVAECTLNAIRKKEFWIFPHSRVPKYVQRKALDHERWIQGMRGLRSKLMTAPVAISKL